MTEVDANLSAANIPIPLRELAAGKAVAIRLQIEVPGAPLPPGPPRPGVYSGPSLSKRIRVWMETRYGERLKADLTPGATLVVLRRDPWLLAIPFLIGRVDAVYDRDVSNKGAQGDPLQRVPSRMNVLALISKLPPAIAVSLTEHEITAIRGTFEPALEVFTSLSIMARMDPLAEAARLDLRKSAEICVEDPGGGGFSRWHSLQGVEKLIKLFMQRSGGIYPEKHNLGQLHALARQRGATHVDRALLKQVQCDADVRYDGSNIPAATAAAAHRCAILVAQTLVRDIARVMPLPSFQSPLHHALYLFGVDQVVEGSPRAYPPFGL